jgi:DNA (cytosine-5)-methyltransferase 1
VNVGSLFSGVGGLDLGLARAGHHHVFFCEADSYRRDVLRARWPGVPVFDDVGALGKPAWGVAVDETGASVDFGRWQARPGLPGGVDLLAGGFPCQDLSVAGRRAGLDGARSGLFFEFARIIDAFRPDWLLLENVPGLLSSNGGRDFGVVLGTLADLRYGVAWRVLNSQFFGVPQRRRRVFIVGAFADGDPSAAARRAGAVLAVGEGCRRHSAPRGEARKDAAVASLSGIGNGGPDDNDGQANRVIAVPMSQRIHDVDGPGPTLTSGNSPNRGGSEGPMIAAPLTKGSATGEGVNQPGRRQEDDVNIVSYAIQERAVSENPDAGPQGAGWKEEMAYTLEARHHVQMVANIGVRRLTPVECERLQGFPDGWTDLGGTPDSRRYSAVGDAVTVNVARWIGERFRGSVVPQEADHEEAA